MSNFTIPPTGFGPGSQPLDDQDEALEYMPLPQDMRTYAPHLPDVEIEDDTYAPALAVLKNIAEACLNAGTMAQFDLSQLDATNRALMAETLGEGEVAAKVWGVPALAVQESVFAGVWCVSGPCRCGPRAALCDGHGQPLRPAPCGPRQRYPDAGGRAECPAPVGRTAG